MSTRTVVSKEIKDQILSRIKNNEVSVSKAAEEHGISSKAIYNWLGKTTGDTPGILELNKLRKKNKDLLDLIGQLTYEVSKLKKNRTSH
jgi:transposase-like protein